MTTTLNMRARTERMQQIVDIIEVLGESAQISLLKYAKFLEADEHDCEYLPYSDAEMEEDIALYDAAMAADDGYRISVKDLRAKYGI